MCFIKLEYTDEQYFFSFQIHSLWNLVYFAILKRNRDVSCRIWNKYIFYFSLSLSLHKCVLSELTFFSLVALLRVSGELGKRDASYYLARRCAFKLLELRRRRRCLSVSSSRRWKDEMRRCGSARKRTRYTGKSYIKLYPLCSSVIHLVQRPPTYGLPLYWRASY